MKDIWFFCNERLQWCLERQLGRDHLWGVGHWVLEHGECFQVLFSALLFVSWMKADIMMTTCRNENVTSDTRLEMGGGEVKWYQDWWKRTCLPPLAPSPRSAPAAAHRPTARGKRWPEPASEVPPSATSHRPHSNTDMRCTCSAQSSSILTLI